MDNGIAEKILAYATSLKADAAEVYLRSYRSTTVEVKGQKVDAFDRARDIGAGLRVICGGRLGFAFTTDLTDAALRTLAQSAVTNAQTTEPDPFHTIPEQVAATYPSAVIFDPEIVALSEKDKIDRAMALERAAFAVDKRIKIRKASTSFSDAETLIMNSQGAAVAYRSTACSSSIEAVAEEGGESQAGSEFDVKRFYRRLEIEAVGRRAAQRALDLLGARHIDSIKAPVVLEASVAQEFLSLMASGFSAESVQKKRSLFIGKLNTDVASSSVTVHDDGILEGGLGTAPSDDEAVPLEKKTVIDKGPSCPPPLQHLHCEQGQDRVHGERHARRLQGIARRRRD